MIPQQKHRRRQALIKAGLPIPEELRPAPRGQKTSGYLRQTPEPNPLRCITKSSRYNARKWYEKRNLPVPEWCGTIRDGRTVWTINNSGGMSLAEYMQIPWPPWANWKAVDKSGDAFFYENEPTQKERTWSAKGRVQMLGEVKASKWQETKVAKDGA